MRVLLIHPEDSPRRGPWTREHWDLLVDLGQSSAYSAEAWGRQYGCPVIRSEVFRKEVSDLRLVRDLFAPGHGRLGDEEGIDWWDSLSLLIVPEAATLLALRRMVPEINASAELWSTRSGVAATMMGILLGASVQTFEGGWLTRSVARAKHYAGLTRRFSPGQIKEIFLDKYDSGYRWRSRFASKPRAGVDPVVLIPSAYGNVSRMAAAYALLLPEQPFLMVTTRRSAYQFAPAPNIEVRDLAAYFKEDASASESASLLERWLKLREDLVATAEFRVLAQAGVLDPFPHWIRNGLLTRNAWREVLNREPVCGVLCGDDSNLYTRLPALLAAKRQIPTVDFHHGAFDGRYILKNIECDIYLAKNEMERDYLTRVCGVPADRVEIGAPSTEPAPSGNQIEKNLRTAAILFSEPYEVTGMRAEEVYGEILAPLCRIARENGRQLIVKLHPFESRAQRLRIIQNVLTAEDQKLVTVVGGPLSNELLARAWFGITVESTTALDCLRNGVPSFLCRWLALSPYGYLEQYGRFGIGQMLDNAEMLKEIPRRLEKPSNLRIGAESLSITAHPARLKKWLTSRSSENIGVKAVS
jgi:hypothetical protein